MRIITIEERDPMGGSRVIARFGLDGILDENFGERRPDIRELVDVRKALHDLILAEKDKAVAALSESEEQAKQDALMLSAATEVEAKALAEAEAQHAFVAAHAKRADDALKAAKQRVAEAEAGEQA